MAKIDTQADQDFIQEKIDQDVISIEEVKEVFERLKQFMDILENSVGEIVDRLEAVEDAL